MDVGILSLMWGTWLNVVHKNGLIVAMDTFFLIYSVSADIYAFGHNIILSHTAHISL